ncbi:nucleotide-diphospho-sugar transferase [Obba rivulosa]|uniref:Nucleotide-diphospho-sugar transferase n=1 Tax=Obba rivulosa TaxID=1052685 RepID=A0A8E2DL07_9APHY|nr:nucleotide-diphospho-sugar transferase [Obba rivulosa]
MFNRYRDYVSLWSMDALPMKRRNYWHYILIAASTTLNAILLYNLFFGSRRLEPLENYQKLNIQPLLDAASVNHVISSEHAVVTAMYTDTYATAIATLGHSLNKVNTTARRILLYLPDKVSARALCIASSTGFDPLPISRIDPPHGGKGIYKRFIDQYSKLNLWTLDQHDVKSAVYLDADTLVLQNFDELFSLPYSFAAVPDIFVDSRGFTLGFNAGVLVMRPSTEVFIDMCAKLSEADFPLHNAEQAFLNQYFAADTVRLPYVYNANLAIKQRSPKVWEDVWAKARIVHYTTVKPFIDDAHPESEVNFHHLRKLLSSKLGQQRGLFDQELEAWAEAWRDTRRLYGDLFATCARGGAGR